MTKPTIGIEIELPWGYMLDRVDPEAGELLGNSRGYWSLTAKEQARVQEGFDAVDAQYKEQVRDVFGEDIAEGNDGYTEFALRPKAEAEELVAVTTPLFTEGILREDEVYSLHVTLGNVRCSNSAWLVLMAAEVSGGTTPKRIKQQKTWDRKGQAGILKRHPAEMALGARHGFEMRTLALNGLAGLSQTLHIVQGVGEQLARRDAGDTTAAGALHDLHQHLMLGTQEKGIDASVKWTNPQDDITPWLKMSAALQDPEWQKRMEAGVLDIISNAA